MKNQERKTKKENQERKSGKKTRENQGEKTKKNQIKKNQTNQKKKPKKKNYRKKTQRKTKEKSKKKPKKKPKKKQRKNQREKTDQKNKSLPLNAYPVMQTVSAKLSSRNAEFSGYFHSHSHSRLCRLLRLSVALQRSLHSIGRLRSVHPKSFFTLLVYLVRERCIAPSFLSLKGIRCP